MDARGLPRHEVGGLLAVFAFTVARGFYMRDMTPEAVERTGRGRRHRRGLGRNRLGRRQAGVDHHALSWGRGGSRDRA
jgi:hypothetical protein